MKKICLIIVFLCIPTGAQAGAIANAAIAITESLHLQLEKKFDGSIKEFPFMMTTPADINNLVESTPLGRQFAQELSTQFVQKGYLLQEPRLANNIILSEAVGELILSRSPALVNSKIAIGYLVAGTYVFSANHVRLSIEIIEASTSRIVAMASTSIPLTETMKPLLKKTKTSHVETGLNTVSTPSVFTKIE